MNVTPEMPRYRIFLNPDWVGGENQGAAVIVKIDGQITCFLRHQIVDAAGEFTVFQAHRFWQSRKRQIGPWMKCHVALIRGVAPFVLTFEFDRETLANGPDCRANCDISLRCAGNNFDRWLCGDGLIAKGCDRIDQCVKFIAFLTECLKPHPRRSA